MGTKIHQYEGGKGVVIDSTFGVALWRRTQAAFKWSQSCCKKCAVLITIQTQAPYCTNTNNEAEK